MKFMTTINVNNFLGSRSKEEEGQDATRAKKTEDALRQWVADFPQYSATVLRLVAMDTSFMVIGEGENDNVTAGAVLELYAALPREHVMFSTVFATELAQTASMPAEAQS